MIDNTNHQMDQFEEQVRKSVRAFNESSIPTGLTPAAVLLGLVRRPSGPEVIFTLRSMTVATHKGQISFPGGVAEPGDKGPLHTALRETHEEIGIPPEAIQVVGFLDSLDTVTGFWITPVVGFVDDAVPCRTQQDEVEEVFGVSLGELMDPRHLEISTRWYQGRSYVDHRFHVAGRVIWGATGRIVHNFIEALRNRGFFSMDCAGPSGGL